MGVNISGKQEVCNVERLNMLRGENSCASKAASKRYEELMSLSVHVQESVHDVLAHEIRSVQVVSFF